MERLPMIWVYCFALVITMKTSSAIDTIFSNQTLTDGETLVSKAEVFELGFFGPENASFRYLGIWYKKISVRTVVWVANREPPLNDPAGFLKINDMGTLELRSVGNTLVWSSESSKPAADMNPVARILDTGNLVIRDDISGDIIWQSFDHPGDTWLPGMKIGVDLVTGITWKLTSWKSREDPSSGSYTVWMDNNGYPQLYNMKDESSFQQRIGYWNGLGFTGMRGLGQNILYTFDFVLTQEEVSCKYTVLNSSLLTRMILDQQGRFYQLVWVPRTQEWMVYMALLQDNCDSYGVCGPYGSCNINNSPMCGCLRGFVPKLPEEWSVADWKNGCKRNISTADGYGFIKYNNLKPPDSRDAWVNVSMSLKECENFCARNVSCTAYANIDVRDGGSGCLQWSSELLDIRGTLEKDVSGQDIYIKMPSYDLIRDQKKKNKKKLYLVVIMSIVSAMVLLVFGTILYAWRKKKKLHLKVNKERKQDSELPLFSLSKIIKATSNFSINNKIGQGGFGAVYKGVLDEGVEIAVKRLSKTSRQGLAEFQNEKLYVLPNFSIEIL